MKAKSYIFFNLVCMHIFSQSSIPFNTFKDPVEGLNFLNTGLSHSPIYLIRCSIPSKYDEHVSKCAIPYPALLTFQYPASSNLNMAKLDTPLEKRMGIAWRRKGDKTFVAVVCRPLASLPLSGSVNACVTQRKQWRLKYYTQTFQKTSKEMKGRRGEPYPTCYSFKLCQRRQILLLLIFWATQRYLNRHHNVTQK